MRFNEINLMLAAAVILGTAGGATAKSLPDGYCGIVYASEPSLGAVRAWIVDNPSFPPAGVYRTNNEFLAITGGIIAIEGWEERVAALASAGRIPPGSFCSARGLVEAVSPVDFLPGAAPAALASVATTDVAWDELPVQEEGPVEPPMEATAPVPAREADPAPMAPDDEIDRAMADCDPVMTPCESVRTQLEADRERRKPILRLAQEQGGDLAARCDDNTSILDLCWKLAPDEMEAVLTRDGFDCKTYLSSLGVECQKGEGGPRVNLARDVLKFDCQAVNACGLTAREASQAAITAGLVDRMEPTDVRQITGLFGDTAVVETYCGRAEDGQKLCLDASTRGDVDFWLHLGTMGRGGVQF